MAGEETAETGTQHSNKRDQKGPWGLVSVQKDSKNMYKAPKVTKRRVRTRVGEEG